ncbi:hypothetical protein SPD48_09670 [Pseudogracilibacillus sp. SE30717A]|uniref:hypothetical protein n=1 Tax=Pseudogracilibacillus sp. SE30717A TaxID=3098293 RepID=UPI00300E3357
MKNLVHEYQLIGIESKKVYMEGKSRADCFRKLQKQHPYFIEHNGRKQAVQRLYPEALVLVRG